MLAARNLLGARNLTSRTSRQGQRDTYVNVTYAGARQVTPIVRQSSQPAWNFPLFFPLESSALKPVGPTSWEEEGVLVLAVMDINSVPGDEELGSVNLVVPRLLLGGPGSTWEQWVPLRKVRRLYCHTYC